MDSWPVQFHLQVTERSDKETMVTIMDRQDGVSNRLRDLGFAKGSRIRLYGKDLYLVSDPIVDSEGYSVETLERKSGVVRQIRIPLMVTIMAEEEVAAHEELLAA